MADTKPNTPATPATPATHYAHSSAGETPAPVKPEVHKNIPKVPVAGPTGPDPKIEDFKGEYVRVSDGELYALAISVGDPDGRTHHCKNDLHFWEGTLEQFKKEFMEKGSKEMPTAEAKAKTDYEARDKARKEREAELGKAEKKEDK